MKVLILGREGMLGAHLTRLFQESSIPFAATTRRDSDAPTYLSCKADDFNASRLLTLISGFDVVINCLVVRSPEPGPAYSDALFVNSIVPHLVATACHKSGAYMIHISTDGVFAGRATPYFEDDTPDGVGRYSSSKILGEVHGPRTLNIRCSIIGHEIPARGGLLEWFLAQDKPVTGFSNVIWNGVTTLQLGLFIMQLLRQGELEELVRSTNTIHFSPNEPMTKFSLLQQIKEEYGVSAHILPTESATPSSRVLKSRFSNYFHQGSRFKDALQDLRVFYTR